MPPATFECLESVPGYFISRVTVVPSRVKFIDDPMSELLRRASSCDFFQTCGSFEMRSLRQACSSR